MYGRRGCGGASNRPNRVKIVMPRELRRCAGEVAHKQQATAPGGLSSSVGLYAGRVPRSAPAALPKPDMSRNMDACGSRSRRRYASGSVCRRPVEQSSAVLGARVGGRVFLIPVGAARTTLECGFARVKRRGIGAGSAGAQGPQVVHGWSDPGPDEPASAWLMKGEPRRRCSLSQRKGSWKGAAMHGGCRAQGDVHPHPGVGWLLAAPGLTRAKAISQGESPWCWSPVS
jgi:hypothetical protein